VDSEKLQTPEVLIEVTLALGRQFLELLPKRAILAHGRVTILHGGATPGDPTLSRFLQFSKDFHRFPLWHNRSFKDFVVKQNYLTKGK
jgi:hypothetical protein